MAFNIDTLFDFAIAELRQFANAHGHETFYAFAIDAGLLCLNSEESFATTLAKYRADWESKARPINRWEDLTKADLQDADYLLDLEERCSGLDRSNRTACLDVINRDRARFRQLGNPYLKPEKILALRGNTGDWAYQGFAEMTAATGFDDGAYQEHYDMTDEEQKTSAYGAAMDKLVRRLVEAEAFSCLRCSPDFYATRVEHNY